MSKLQFNPKAPAFQPSKTPVASVSLGSSNGAASSPAPQMFYPVPTLSPLVSPGVDPILGDALPVASAETTTVIQAMLDLSTAHKISFLGTLPALPALRSLEKVKLKPYLATLMPHGAQRYLLLTLNGNVYLVNRKMITFNATRFFEREFITEATEKSLLDGFLVRRQDGSLQFLIFDAVAVGNVSVRAMPLQTRVERARRVFNAVLDTVDLLAEATFATERGEEPEQEVFQVRFHAYYPLEELGRLASVAAASRKNAARLPWEFGGYFLTPAGGYYRLGYNDQVIRWKPEHQIYADFLLSTVSVPGFKEPWHQLQKLDAMMGLTVHDWLLDEKGALEAAGAQSGMVIECYWDPSGRTCVPTAAKGGKTEKKMFKGGWVFHRIRKDRKVPNESWMIQKVVDQIDQWMTEHAFLSALRITEKDKKKLAEEQREASRKH